MTQGSMKGMIEKAREKGEGLDREKANGSRPTLPGYGSEEGSEFHEWNDLAALILEAEIKDELATGYAQEIAIQKAKQNGDGMVENTARVETNMQNLALRVASSSDELYVVKTLISEDMWAQKKMERLIRREQIRDRLSDVEELMYLAIHKLKDRVMNGLVKESAELIAVGQFADRMLQVASGKGPIQEGTGLRGPSGLAIQINNMNGMIPNGDLPGPGSLGTINLTLSNRVHQQLIEEKPIDPFNDTNRFLNSIEMLDAKEIPHLLTEGREQEEADEISDL